MSADILEIERSERPEGREASRRSINPLDCTTYSFLYSPLCSQLRWFSGLPR